MASLSASAHAAGAATASCSLYASPSGSDSTGNGSQTSPFQTAQQLIDTLTPGQTGCLMAGTYNTSPGLRFNTGGTDSAPITLASAPGQTATLAGGDIYMPTGSDYVTLENLHIDGSATTQNSIQIFGSHDALIGDNITNHSQHNSCIIMGFPGWTPYPTGTLIEDNVIHQCGNTADGNKDHAIYFSQSIGATVTNNIIWGTAAFALHIYPGAVNNTITHNVIDDNGYGVIFGGGAGPENTVSDGNTVAYNIIADSNTGYNVSSSGDASATNNTFNHNCTYNSTSFHGDGENIANSGGFTTAANISGSDALFANESAHTAAGYELQPGSACRSTVGYDTAALLAGGPPHPVSARSSKKHTHVARAARLTKPHRLVHQHNRHRAGHRATR
ncbi:MAG: right-handed parallel beta-helix repeat-containing protein [Actinomycetota bacterium]|nr:right-handed parallel beta-helix repeat-containing protein [Actinomycetota bacterium]